MKNKPVILYLLVVLFLGIYACSGISENDKHDKVSEGGTFDREIDFLPDFDEDEMITGKIMYDVPIINPLFTDRTKQNPDWFWENLPEPSGDKFIKELINKVKEGKLQAYYYNPICDYESFEAIPIDNQKKYLSNKMSMNVDFVDHKSGDQQIKTVSIEFGHEHVKKLRFLEEWYLADGIFYKKVIAVAPFFTVQYPGIEEDFSTVFFWILLDENIKPVL